jgi:molybdate transport system regulatory protein
MIDKHGSISEAGRQLGMSYRRAWLLVDSLNRCFRNPVVASQHGGQLGGGTSLTKLGQAVVHHYRAVESAAVTAAAVHIRALSEEVADETTRVGIIKPRRVTLSLD